MTTNDIEVDLSLSGYPLSLLLSIIISWTNYDLTMNFIGVIIDMIARYETKVKDWSMLSLWNTLTIKLF